MPDAEATRRIPSHLLPSSIALDQSSLQRTARDRDELEEEIATTLVHEAGHFLGIGDDQRWARHATSTRCAGRVLDGLEVEEELVGPCTGTSTSCAVRSRPGR